MPASAAMSAIEASAPTERMARMAASASSALRASGSGRTRVVGGVMCRSGHCAVGELQVVVLVGGVDPVLELDHAHLLVAMAQPAVVAVQQAQLLAVRHDLREQHLLEDH